MSHFCCSLAKNDPGARSAMSAASQLPGRRPTDVDHAPAPACLSKIWLWFDIYNLSNVELDIPLLQKSE